MLKKTSYASGGRNKHTGVTTNSSEREGDLNLWFTIIADKERK